MTERSVTASAVPERTAARIGGHRWLSVAGQVGARSLDRVNGPQLVSWPVFGVTLAVGIVVHLLGSPDLPSGHVPQRLVAAFAGNVALFGVLLAFGPWRRRPGAAGRVWLVAALVLGGAVRGVVLQALLFAFGAAASLNVAYRLPAGIATSAFTAAVVSAIIGAMRERATRRAAAEDVRDGLVAAIQALDERIEERQEQAAERIARDLQTQLDVVFGATADLDERLRDLADDVVRPLSHALAETVPAPQTFVSTRAVARLRLSDAWRELRAIDGLSPLWLTVIPAILVLPPAFAFIAGDRVVAFLAVLLASLLGATAIARVIAARVTRGRGPLAQAVVLTTALVLLNTVGYLLMSTVRTGQHALLLTGFIFIPLIGWSLAIAASSRRAIADADAQMAADTARLRWVSARLAAIRWQQQGDLSRALHGPVQAAIHAAVSQLGRASAEGEDLGSVIAQQRDVLAAAIMRLTLPDPQGPDIDATLAAATATWAGIAEVVVVIEPDARAALQADTVSAGVLIDVVVEAVSNAIRHGEATQVSIGVTLAGADLAEIVIRDNGRGPHDDTASRPETSGPVSNGLGVELMRRCSVEFERRVEPDGFVIRALLPVGG